MLFLYLSISFGASQVALVVKNPPANAGDARDTDSIPGSGRSPGVRNGTHSSILAWRIPRTEEPGGLQSMGPQRVQRDQIHTYIFHSIEMILSFFYFFMLICLNRLIFKLRYNSFTTIVILLKCTVLWSFRIFIKLYKHHQYLIPGHFNHPQKEIPYPSAIIPH